MRLELLALLCGVAVPLAILSNLPNYVVRIARVNAANVAMNRELTSAGSSLAGCTFLAPPPQRTTPTAPTLSSLPEARAAIRSALSKRKYLQIIEIAETRAPWIRSDPSVVLPIGLAYYALGERGAAIGIWREHPRIAGYFSHTGDICKSQHKLWQSEERYRIAAAIDPSQPANFYALAALKWSYPSETVYWLRRGIEVDKADSLSRRFALAQLALVETNWPEAIRLLQSMLELEASPGRAGTIRRVANRQWILFFLGIAYSRSGDLGTAERHYWAALDVDPTMGQAHMELGNIAVAKKRCTASLQHFARAAQLDPPLAPAALLAMARVHASEATAECGLK